MNICIDARTLMDARYSGVSEYALNLISNILKLDSDSEYRLFYNSFRAVQRMPRFGSANVKTVRYGYPNKILNYLFFKFFNYPRIDKNLNADLLFMPHINFIGMSAACKSVITVHDLSFLRYREFFSARKNFWHKMLNVKRLIGRFDCVVAASANTKRDIVELCGIEENKIKIIYAGVGGEFRKISEVDAQLPEIRHKYGLPDEFILYLGTLEPRKNVAGVIRAYNLFRIQNRELRNARLVIAGGQGWKFGDIYEEWERSAFKSDIKFLGYVSNQDRPYLYNLASVFIYPSFYEGFGFPPLEAMACGTPVISSCAASLPEVAGGAALMIDPHNENDMALAMEKILTDKKLSHRLAALGFERAEKFRWENTAKAYLEIFNNLQPNG